MKRWDFYVASGCIIAEVTQSFRVTAKVLTHRTYHESSFRQERPHANRRTKISTTYSTDVTLRKLSSDSGLLSHLFHPVFFCFNTKAVTLVTDLLALLLLGLGTVSWLNYPQQRFSGRQTISFSLMIRTFPGRLA